MRWKDVPGWEGFYQVSDQGWVKSVARLVPRGEGSFLPIREYVTRGGRQSNGYLAASLRRENQTTKIGVHRLVLLAFVGPAPEGNEACHADGDRQHNALSNLRWDTRGGNMRDAVSHGTHHQSSKTHCKRGHEFTPENTDRTNDGRRCRACQQMHRLAYENRKANAR